MMSQNDRTIFTTNITYMFDHVCLYVDKTSGNLKTEFIMQLECIAFKVTLISEYFKFFATVIPQYSHYR